jgi:NodT family efflux transporter outer membrane factor (OMF) lipoprotein
MIQGCAGHQLNREGPPPVEMPSAYSRDDGKEDLRPAWWETFNDPGLSHAVAVALRENAGIRQTWARLAQAESAARQVAAGGVPEVSAGLDLSRSRTSIELGGEGGERTVTSSLYSVSVAAGYEVDLWGRVASLEGAAQAAAEATREDFDSASMTLAAKIAEVWFALAEGSQQLELLQRQAELARTYLLLVEMRFSLGQAAAIDVYQQRQQLAATESQVPLAEARVAVLRNLLATLLGRPAGTAFLPEFPVSLPQLPPAPAAGIPSDLLQQRPDIRAASARIRAADQHVAAAMAERYPSLRLSGRAGFQWRDAAKVFDNWIYQVAAALVKPVYDGQRRDEEVVRKKAVLTEMMESYRQAVLEALQEVEDALAREARQETYIQELGRRTMIARSTLERSRFRYAQGQSDYLPVVASLLALQNLEREEVAARRDALLYRIQLYRALGGGPTSADGDAP